jgi:gliding motility-associated-like protein
MKFHRKLLLFAVLLFLVVTGHAQTYQWAKSIGGSNEDLSSCVAVDNNGFVYIAGYFQGSNIDFDPSPTASTLLTSSSNSRDGYLAKFTTTGNFVWAFKIGGSNKDVIQGVSVDASGNPFVTGYFRGANVDFDPGPGTAFLTSVGDDGSDPGYGGDIFIAKYSPAGQYQWAFNIGGTLIGDAGITIANDAAGNVYAGGYFGNSADFDPSPTGTQLLNGASGTAYIAKYNGNGQYQWAFNFGLGNSNNSPFGMKVDAAGNVYTTGYFSGTNIDFNPSPTVTNTLSSNGNFEVFVSKYNTNGQYQWAFSMGGVNLDVGRDIEIDPSGNVYVVGDFNGTNIDFDPSPTGTALFSTVGFDVFLAKYNNNGQFQWAKKYGGTGNDISWSLAYANNAIYITGSFQNTINFSPTGVDNLTSNGANDFYMTKFDVNGNYICSFAIGGSGNDDAYRVDADNAGNLFVTGILSSANTDFNPSTSVTSNLSANGLSDIFLASYTWADNVLPTGTLTGNSIACGTSGQGQLTFTASAGTGPFTIEYSNGVTTYTQTNVQSGVPFNLVPNPVTTTTYTLLSVRGSEKCAAVNNPSNVTATVTSTSAGLVDFSYAQDICNPKKIQFFNASQGSTSYTWDFGNSTTNIGNANPIVTYASYGTYPVKLKVQTSNGCTDSITKNISVNVQQDNNLITTSDLAICAGSSTSLNISDTGLTHCWQPITGISNVNSATPTITPAVTTTYYYTSQTLGSNLVINGGFSAGNTGFTSDYAPAFPNLLEGQYWVGNNVLSWNPNLTACGDHTAGNGNMLLVNGSSVQNAKIWVQTIPVTPNSNYAFSTWIQSLHAINPANVKFSINGNIIGNNITAGSVACQWSRFFTTWNSGNSTTAIISIVNNNTIALGNDFALDDISFSPVIMKQDSVTINVMSCTNATASFTSPDTVCVNKPVSIVNTSSGTTTQYWSFCNTDLSTVTPIETTFGNPSSLLDIPVSIDYALYNGNYYGFITNNGTTPGLIRLDYGNSLLNNPTPVNLGNFGGNFPRSMQGLQIINTNGKWYLVVVGGDMNILVQSRVIVFDFGAALTNTSPTFNSWLNIGGLDYPTGLHVFQSGINWYGIATNAWSGTITRFNFGTNFSSVTATNLGNIGLANIPTGLFPIKEGGNYYMFIANTGNSTLTRLNFGNSFLNSPTGVNLGTLGGILNGPRDLHIFKDCNKITGFVLNATANSMVRLNFSTLTSTPTATSLSNSGSFSNPISFSRVFRDGSDIYSFWVNANNTFGRLKFPGCNIGTPLSSTLVTPPSISYPIPGTYSIKLTVDEGLETEGSFCKPIVVMPNPLHSPILDISLCTGDSVTLNAAVASATYVWSTGATTSSIKAKSAGTYWVESTVTGGCSVRDSMVITLKAAASVYAGIDVSICGSDSALLSATGTGSFSWTPTSGLSNPAINSPKAHPSTNTDYIVTLTAANGCTAKDTVNVAVLSAGASLDFSYAQDICNPKTIQFLNASQGATSLTWDFGNSTTNIGSANPIVTYAAFGIYPVKLKIQVPNGCTDSITKNIAVNVLQDNNLIATNDLSVCAGNGISLNIQDTGLNHCWSPITGISNVNSATPTITPAATTTYYFTSQTLGNNLVVNGDFSGGNIGFTSDYIAAFPNTAEGQYWVGNNPLSWNVGLTSCTEHTTGTGQMMMVNGSPIANSKIWTQTIPVIPNSNYAFSTWIQSLHATNPANVKFSINGNIIGNNVTAGSVACNWNRFFATWNSGNSTTAIISIVNNNTIAVGNDFALDDISFSPVIMKQDSIKITVTPPPTITGSALASSICEADSSQLNASGAANFSWLPTTGLSNPNIANPKASPAATTTYTVSGFDVAGCAGTNTVTVTIKAKPVITKSADATICKDSIVQISTSAPNALSYSWLPVTGLNNASSNNPLATPASTTNYIVTVTGTNNCVNKDSVLVTVLAKPTVQIRVDTSVCDKVPIVLTTNNTGATSFSWIPATGLSSTTSPSPIATPSISTQYIVTAMNGSCFAKDTMNLGIKPLPTVIKSADTIICKTGTANLSVSGGASYAWTPAYALASPSSGTTTANPDTTIKYYVAVTGSNACVSNDSIKVTVNPKPVFALQPVIATICKGDSVLLTASGGDLYGWVPNTNIVSATSAATKVFPPVATTYKVGITNSVCKVTDTLSAVISLNGSLTTSVSSSNNIDCSHGQSTLLATGGVNYTWTAAPGIGNLNTASPIVVPIQTTTYYVKVVDAKGCTGYDSVKVNVDFTAGASQYLLPTAFTPDGNGKNDCFGLKYWGVVTQLDFNVYSRWGQLVFHTNNPNDCWDGKINGQPQDSGTFVYQIKAKTACGEIYRKGTIILIR